ncbi:MAG: hydroxylamine reductase, partial [bacterium]
MSMFCYQCQETAKNEGCTAQGICGKNAETANMQDMLIFALRGVAVYHERLKELGLQRNGLGRFVTEALFTTVTNVSFDVDKDAEMVEKALALRDELRDLLTAKTGAAATVGLPEAALWSGTKDSYAAKAATVGVMATENEDIRSLRELLMYGLKGMAAYAHHALVLGYEKDEIHDFLLEGLAA